MTALAALRVLFSLANTVLGYLKQNQLIEAGHAKAIAESLTQVSHELDEIARARKRFRTDREYRERVREQYRVEDE